MAAADPARSGGGAARTTWVRAGATSPKPKPIIVKGTSRNQYDVSTWTKDIHTRLNPMTTKPPVMMRLAPKRKASRATRNEPSNSPIKKGMNASPATTTDMF